MDPTKNSSAPASPPLDLTTLPYLSPTLETLQLAAKLDPFPACGMCPVALWYKTAKILNCFCSRMHASAWSGNAEAAVLHYDATVLNCDGQVIAILQMESQANQA